VSKSRYPGSGSDDPSQLGPECDPEPRHASARFDIDRAFNDFLDAGDDPKAWLEASPLLTALKFRSEGLPARPTVCHCGYPFQDGTGLWDHSVCYPGIVVD
jgi:hypothetical protein